uniref:Uncharacterized protein n=1 Tax=viral metagenome TaxID=1070528 RepID=A0A6C0AMD0_9ZZZZ
MLLITKTTKIDIFSFRFLFMENLKANHVRISEILEFVHPNRYLRLPKIHLSEEYIVEEFDRSRPLWHEDIWSALSTEAKANYIKAIKECIIILAKYDFFLRGVEVYIQSDGSLILSNLARVHHTHQEYLSVESATILPSFIISKGFLQ